MGFEQRCIAALCSPPVFRLTTFKEISMSGFSDIPVWNKADALTRLMNNQNLLDRVTDLYLSSTPCLLDKLKQSVTQNDLSAAQSEAHTLKGASGNIGAEQMMALFAAIEAAAKEQHEDEIQSLVEQLDSMYQTLEHELRQ